MLWILSYCTTMLLTKDSKVLPNASWWIYEYDCIFYVKDILFSVRIGTIHIAERGVTWKELWLKFIHFIDFSLLPLKVQTPKDVGPGYHQSPFTVGNDRLLKWMGFAWLLLQLEGGRQCHSGVYFQASLPIWTQIASNIRYCLPLMGVMVEGNFPEDSWAEL